MEVQSDSIGSMELRMDTVAFTSKVYGRRGWVESRIINNGHSSDSTHEPKILPTGGGLPHSRLSCDWSPDLGGPRPGHPWVHFGSRAPGVRWCDSRIHPWRDRRAEEGGAAGRPAAVDEPPHSSRRVPPRPRPLRQLSTHRRSHRVPIGSCAPRCGAWCWEATRRDRRSWILSSAGSEDPTRSLW